MKAAGRGTLDITEERVHIVADALAAEGQQPKIELVREKLGGGSYSKISPFLRSWKEKQRPVLTSVDIELPEDLAKVHRSAAAQLWNEASRIASEKISRVKSEADEKVVAAESDRASLEKEIARLEEVVEDLENSEASLRLDGDKLRSDLSESDRMRSVQAETIRQNELGTKRQDKRISELESELRTFQGALSEEKKLRTEAEISRDGLSSELAVARKNEEALAERSSQLEEEVKASVEAMKKLSEKVVRTDALLSERGEKLKKAENAAAEAVRNSVEQAAQRESVGARLDELLREKEALEKKADHWMKQCLEAKTLAGRLEGEIKGMLAVKNSAQKP